MHYTEVFMGVRWLLGPDVSPLNLCLNYLTHSWQVWKCNSSYIASWLPCPIQCAWMRLPCWLCVNIISLVHSGNCFSIILAVFQFFLYLQLAEVWISGGMIFVMLICEWVSEWVSRVQHPYQHILDQFRDTSLPSNSCTGDGKPNNHEKDAGRQK